MDTAKDMYKVYSKTSTADLIKNRMRKVHELSKVQGIKSYWARKEADRLAHMIRQIDAVIQSRADQLPLL